MEKVYLILMCYEDKNVKISQFRPEVFKNEKLAERYCNYLRKFSSINKIQYSIIRTDMYNDMAYIEYLCKF